MQVINNAQEAWKKLSLFGLRGKSQHLGFNKYSGKNGSVLRVDLVTGMKIEFFPAKAPRSERETKVIILKTPGKKGRPAIFSHPKQAHESGVRGRKPMYGPIEMLVFVNHPQQKRGPKPGSVQTSTETLIGGTKPAQKRGRLSEKERIALAPVGSVIKANGGGFWRIIAKGLPSYQEHA